MKKRSVTLSIAAVIVVVVLLFLFVKGLFLKKEYDGTVTKVFDGDTIMVKLNDNSEVCVRIWGIDAPETGKNGKKGQPYSQNITRYVENLCINKKVVIKRKDISYGRIVGEVILPDKKNLGQEVLKRGGAWWYSYYCSDPVYAQLEQEARKSHSGIWSDPNIVPPWVFRHKESLEREGKL